MDIKTDSNFQLIQQARQSSRTAASYQPEPSATGVGLFRDVLSSAAAVGSRVLEATPLGNFTEFGNLQGLLEKQIAVSQEMQAISMASNIEKAKHDAQMAPIRNIRMN